ncbi:unnamed protein product [Clavelina lepadiformis]|uniref:CUB domain-containing protein n=1 Tax=Clavelina lepadiformis TaxID=159417 RepID=A0ABP0G417_CLALP
MEICDRDEHGGGKNSNEAQSRCSVHMIGAHRVDQNSLRYVNDDGCGKTTTLASPYGVVASANWGVGYYLPHQRCEWYLLGREGTIARLKVVAFNTEKDFDTVSIFEGVETDRSLTARLSGQYPRDQFLLIPSSSVSITFVSDGVVQKPGFVFAYDFMNNNFPPSTGCDNENVIFTSPSGAFTSSGYPRLYPNNLRCQWKIMVDPDKVVKINFVDFKTRDSRDFLRIFVDKDNTTILFNSFYGEQSGRDVITDSNRVTILFVSDSQLRDRGFHVTYSSEEPIRCWEQHECGSGKCIPSQYVCDGTIDCAEGSDEMECDSNCSGPAKRNVSSDSEVVLTSMNYPNNYEPSTSLDGKRTSEVIMTSSNRLTISFASDDTVQSRGFYISITASEPGLCPGRFTCDGGECVLKDLVCDGTVDCKDGSDERSCDSGCGGLAEVVDESYVTSYMDVMEKYEDNSNCVWRIRSPDPDKLVSISFNRFATEEKFDILKIYDGVGRNKTLKGVQICHQCILLSFIKNYYVSLIVSYSGVIKPPDYVSTTSDVTIIFTSDGSVTGPG